MSRLTETRIRGMKCEKREEFRDDIVPGLWLRVGAGDRGSKTWVFRFRQEGAQRSVTLGSFPDMGLAAARLAATSVRDGTNDPKKKAPTPPPSKTLAEVAEDFIATPLFQKNRTAAERAQTIRTGIVPYVGAIQITAFTRKDAKGLVDRYMADGKPSMARRIKAQLSQVLGHAVEEEMIPFNPMAGMRMPAPIEVRDRYLSREELSDFWKYLNTEAAQRDPMRRAIRWLVVTGQRRNECLFVDKSEIDTTQKRWTLPSDRTKNKIEHVLPITEWHLELLGSAADNGYYFASPKPEYETLSPRSLTNHVSDYCDTRGIINAFTPHDIRRTMTTYLAELGFPEDQIGRALNHARRSVTGRHYDKFAYLPQKLEIMEAWRDFLKAL